MKGEGEVKLNMAIGKGEQALRSSNKEGQKVIQTQLQTLKDVWGNIMGSSSMPRGTEPIFNVSLPESNPVT